MVMSLKWRLLSGDEAFRRVEMLMISEGASGSRGCLEGAIFINFGRNEGR